MTQNMQKQRMGQIFIIFVLLIAVSSVSTAQNQLSDLETLTDLIQVAIINDKNLQLTNLQLLEVEAGLAGVNSALHPRLILNGEYKLENLANNQQIMMAQQQGVMMEQLRDIVGEIPFFPDLPPSGPGYDLTDTAHTGTLSATYYQQLGFNNELQLANDQASLGYDMVSLQQEQALTEVILNVQESYKNVIVAYHGRQLAEKAVANAEAKLAVTEARYAAETANELTVLEAQNQVLTSQSQLLAATNGFELALAHLLQVLGMEISDFDQASSWIENLANTVQPNPKQWEIDLSETVEYGLENRIEVQLLNKQLVMAESELAAYQRDNDWTANLNGHYVKDQVIFQAGLDSSRALTGTIVYSDTKLPNYDDQLTDQNSTNPWQITVGASYTFGGGGTREAETQRLESSVAQTKLQLATLKDGLYLDIYAKYQQLNQAWTEHQLALQGKLQAEKTLSNLQQMYDLGSVAETDLRDGKLYLAQAEVQVISSVLNYQAKTLQFANALGVDSNKMLQILDQEY